jgi:hypothetical protein
MLTAMTLALPPRTNIPRPTKKYPKDTPNRVFNKLAWHQIYGTEGVGVDEPGHSTDQGKKATRPSLKNQGMMEKA